MAKNYGYKDIMSALAANGTGESFLGSDYENIIAEVAVTGTGSGTLKFQGSVRRPEISTVDFSAAATSSNPWGYVQAVNLSSGTAVDGATGLSLSGAAVYLLEINVNGLDQVSATLSNVSGTIGVSIRIKGYNNQ